MIMSCSRFLQPLIGIEDSMSSRGELVDTSSCPFDHRRLQVQLTSPSHPPNAGQASFPLETFEGSRRVDDWSGRPCENRGEIHPLAHNYPLDSRHGSTLR